MRKYPDNSATEAMIEATQQMFRKPLVAKWTDIDDCNVTMSEFSITIEQRKRPLRHRVVCTTDPEFMLTAARILAQHAAKLRGES